MKLSNKLYDVLKFIVTIVSPALCTLIATLAAIYGFNSAIIVGTITAITTFVGAIIGISTVKYNKEIEEAENVDKSE